MVVLNGQCSLVMKYRFGFGEADALMLEFVGRILCSVILNFEWLHYAYFICIKKRLTVPSVARTPKTSKQKALSAQGCISRFLGGVRWLLIMTNGPVSIL
ncbi:hypothetical protein D3C73_1414720 [compost metagenome]